MTKEQMQAWQDKANSGDIYDSVDDELIEYQHMLVQRLNDFNNT